MAEALPPLAHRRLRPGRPRKIPPLAGLEAAVEHSRSVDIPTSRLLDLRQAAGYLGVSVWTVRDLEAAGVLPRVLIPLGNGYSTLRKLLFDRADLDRLIEAWKGE
jgi:hypothetical protein